VGGGKGPDLQLVRTRLKPKEIAEQIHDGGEVMPSYGKILTAPEIKDLVAYLCAKRKVIVKAPPAAPDIIAPAPDPR
jgi:mono/diheme cytochrome c family protein